MKFLGQPVIACRISAEVFEAAKSIFNAMAETIGFFVESEWLFAIAFAGNDSLSPALIKPVPQRCAVVSLIAEEFLLQSGAADHVFGKRAIMRLAAG